MNPRVVRPFLLGVLALVASAAAAATPGEQLFLREVRPLLQAKCLGCHGEDEKKIKAGLDLRTRAAALRGGESGAPALVPGRPHDSPLFLAVTREDPDWEPMPPKENDALTSEEQEHIKAWIAAGAPWPEGAAPGDDGSSAEPGAGADDVTVKTSGGLSDDWTRRRYQRADLWAYQPLRKPPVPPVAAAGSTATSNPVDAFIAARLAAAGLTPAPAADRRTLLRRATFDLTGLPPAPEEIAAFLADPRSDEEAFADVVERLLASPHYGEQMARHWLDVVRYADSSGFANDFARGSAWRYRDYVVRAFNTDKPYDAFVREQLAGDEIAARAAGTDASQATGAAASDLLIATGFLRMGPWELTGMEVPKVARQRFLDDVTETVGQVLLAHPLQCARCHDHKFDPVPTRDYYALQAVFATTQMADRTAAFLPTENTSGFEEKRYLQQREEHYRAILKRLDAKSIAAARAWYAERGLDPAAFERALEETLGQRKAGRRGRDAGYAEVRTAMMRQGIPEDRIPPKLAGFSPEDYGLERIARKGLERLRWDYDRYEPVALAVYSGRTPELRTVLSPLRVPADPLGQGELERTHILRGGDPFAEGPEVLPAVLSAPTELAGMERVDVPTDIAGRRLALAEWIASPRNPLTARVMVNRIWQWHFGRGLAGNPNNFGATGKKPTHPELLDWLAATFVEGTVPGAPGPWSVKAMHRLIMNSEAYRRASRHPAATQLAQADPEGTSYAVFRPRRLTAEELRDSLLAASGELNRAIGGIPVRPEMNREAALQPRQVMGTFAEAWQPSPRPEQRHRRSLYAQKVRGLVDPFLEVFNAPSPELSCEARETSTVTPQVFALFNSEASLARAIALAARVRRKSPTIDAAIARAFELTLGRAPRADEREACRAHWEAMRTRHANATPPRAGLPREVVREAVEENTGETFTFVEPLEIAADFVPDLGPADVPPETRALAEVCLVLFNTNEFAYVD